MVAAKNYQRVLWWIWFSFCVCIAIILYFVSYAEFSRPYPVGRDFSIWSNLIHPDSVAYSFRMDQAFWEYQTVLSHNPYDPNHWIEYAIVCTTLGEREKDTTRQKQYYITAKAAYLQAIFYMPRSASLYQKVGKLEEILGNFTLADRHWIMAQALAPNRPEFLESAQAYWKMRWENTKSDDHLTLLAWACYQLNRYNPSQYIPHTIAFCHEHAIQQSLESWIPREANLLAIESLLYYRNFTLADELFRKTHPQNTAEESYTCALRGYRFFLHGDFAQGLQNYQRSIDIAQNTKEALRVMFRHVIPLGCSDLIVEWLKIQQLDSQANQLLLYETMISVGYYDVAWQELEKFYKQMLSQKTSNTEHLAHAFFLMSQAVYNLGYNALAISYADQMISSKPNNDTYAMYYCQLLLQNKLDDKIVIYLRTYYRNLARIEEIYSYLAQKYFEQKQYRQARYWTLQHLRLKPDSPKLQEYLRKIPMENTSQ